MRAGRWWAALGLGLGFAGVGTGMAADGPPAAATTDAGPAAVAAEVPWLAAHRARGGDDRRAALGVGRELFLREWLPGDPRSRGGDGLGPVYNAASCVACHRLGGPGGAGPNEVNVQIATVGVSARRSDDDPSPESTPFDALFPVHPGFRTARALVLHRHGVDPDYADWRRGVPGSYPPGLRVTTVERNTPALFGAGRIDELADAVLEATARRVFPGFPEVRGRVGRTADGRVGRFGWKAQTTTLGEFVRNACAVEMGLEVPGHPQPLNPTTPEVPAPGLDLSDAECDALTRYVAALPVPGRRAPMNRAQAEAVDAGERVFLETGCATCHAPRLGHVAGLYSDLLLHDLGDSLADGASYYVSPAPPTPIELARAESSEPPARPSEWRTPPLWGLRDSGPYLHDGRAPSLDLAIRLHGGEARAIRDRYASLNPVQHRQLTAFLLSLSAPRR